MLKRGPWAGEYKRLVRGDTTPGGGAAPCRRIRKFRRAYSLPYHVNPPGAPLCLHRRPRPHDPRRRRRRRRLHRLRPRAPVARGVVIGDRRLPDATATSRRGSRLAAGAAPHRALPPRGRTFEATLAEAGVTVDSRPRWPRRSASGTRDPPCTGCARRSGHGAARSTCRPCGGSTRRRRARCSRLRAVARAPSDARIDLEKHPRVPDEPAGSSTWTRRSPSSAGTHEDTRCRASHAAAAAKVTLDMLTGVDIEKVVSAYETTFSLFGTGENARSTSGTRRRSSTARCCPRPGDHLQRRGRPPHARARVRAGAGDPGRRAAARVRRRHVPGVEHAARGGAVRRAGDRSSGRPTRAPRATRRWASTRP